MRKHHGPGPKPQVPFSNAPAARVQNLKKLEDCCGPDLLAIKLGIPLGRLREMLDGVNFSSEMAYHIETTLVLDSGFMDKPAAVLSPEDQFRLKQLPSDDLHDDLFPVDQAPAANSPSAAAPAPAPEAPQQASLEAQAVTQAPAAQKPSSEPSLVEKAQPEIVKKDLAMTEAVAQSSTPLLGESQEETLRAVRRENFRVLTAPKGFKSRLGELTGLSPANISHRLHGHKIFDRETGDFFCDKLGLPRGWFEAPRTLEDVPSSVIQLLSGAVPASITPVPAQPRTVSKTSLTKPASVPLARTKAQKKASAEQSPTAPTTLSLSAASRGGEQSAPPAAAPAAATPVKTTRRRAAQVVALPAASAVAPALQAPVAPPVAAPLAAPVVVAPVYAPTPAAVAVAERPVVAPVSTAAAGPLAQAALAVLTIKIQSGRLSEERAMTLLAELAAL